MLVTGHHVHYILLLQADENSILFVLKTKYISVTQTLFQRHKCRFGLSILCNSHNPSLEVLTNITKKIQTECPQAKIRN